MFINLISRAKQNLPYVVSESLFHKFIFMEQNEPKDPRHRCQTCAAPSTRIIILVVYNDLISLRGRYRPVSIRLITQYEWIKVPASYTYPLLMSQIKNSTHLIDVPARGGRASLRALMLSHSALALSSISYHSSFPSFPFSHYSCLFFSFQSTRVCLNVFSPVFPRLLSLHCRYFFSQHFVFTSFLLSSFSFCHASVSSAFNYRFSPLILSYSLFPSVTRERLLLSSGQFPQISRPSLFPAPLVNLLASLCLEFNMP